MCHGTVLFSMLAVKEENISPQEVSSDGRQVDCVGPRNKAVSDLLPNLTPVLRSSQSVSKGNSRAWINIQQRIILIVLQEQFWPAAISQPRRQHHNQKPQKHGLLERREREREAKTAARPVILRAAVVAQRSAHT